MKLHLPKVLLTAVLTVVAMSAQGAIESTATATSATIAGSTYGSGTIVFGTVADGTPITPETTGAYTVFTNTKADGTKDSNGGRYKINGTSTESLSGCGNVIVASGSYVAADTTTKNFTGGQLFISNWQYNDITTISNNLLIGETGYTEGNYSTAIRLSATDSASKRVVFTGDVTAIQNSAIAVDGNFSYIEGALNGNAGTTLTLKQSGQLHLSGGGNLSTFNVGSATVTLDTTKSDGSAAAATDYSIATLIGNGVQVNSGTTLTITNKLDGKVTNNGTLNLNGTVNVDKTAGTSSLFLSDTENGYGDLSYNGQIISGSGTTNVAEGIAWQIGGVDATTASFDAASGTLNATLTGGGTIYTVNTDTTFNPQNNSVLNTSTGLTVRNNATLTISAKTGNNNGVIRGDVVVENGSKLVLQANDALGWSGNNVKKLTLNGDASVEMTHSSNETFGGQLILNGTSSITGTNATWDVYESGSSITVGADANVAINTKKLNFRRNDATFTVGNNATLTIAAEMTKGDRGNNILHLDNGNAATTVNLNGGGNISGLFLSGGTTNINKNLTIEKLMLSKNNKDTALTIAAGTTLNVTGTTTSSESGGNASFELGNWGSTNTVNLYGTLIANAGISMEGNVNATINIEDGGVLSMNAGLWGVKREGSTAAKLNVKSGGTLLAGTSTQETPAHNSLVNVVLNDGAKMGGVYGSETTATIHQNLNLQDNATVTMLTEEGKTLELLGTLSNATGSVTAQGGGTLTLSNAAELANVTVADDTTVKFTGTTTIGSDLTLGSGAAVVNNGTLTVSGTSSFTAADSILAQTAHDRTSGNGYGTITNTVALNNFITGTGTTELSDVSVNGTAGSYDATTGEITFTTDSDVYYINDSSANITITGAAVLADKEQTQNSYIVINDAGNSLQMTGEDTVLNANGQGLWMNGGTLTVENGATLNVRAGEADAITITDATVTTSGNANLGHNDGNNNNFYAAVQLAGDAVATGSKVNAYTFTDGTLTIDSGTDTTITSATLHDVVVESGSDITVAGYDTHTNVTMNSLSAADSALAISDGVSLSIADTTTTTVDSLTLGNNAAITIGEHNGTLAITSSVVVGLSTTVNADLVVGNDAVMDFTASSSITLGCTVQIGDGVTLVLNSSEIAAIMHGQALVIVEGAEGTTLAEAVQLGTDIKFIDENNNDLNNLGLRLDTVATATGWNVVVAPEPATATLSLLALAALAARRKRH